MASLENIWKGISGTAKVPLGSTRHWKLSQVPWKINPNTNEATKEFTTAEFYGCTVVLIFDGKQAVIGHFHQYRGTDKVMYNETKVEEYITDGGLSKELDYLDFNAASHAWIIHSSPRASVGYRKIVEFLTESSIPKENIHNYTYSETPPLSSLGSTFEGPKGKTVLQWKRTATGAILSVYIQEDNPVATFSYDNNGEPL